MFLTRAKSIAACGAEAFELNAGDLLRIVDPEGRQVADLVCFDRRDTREVFSAGQTIDRSGGIYLREGDGLFSSRNRELLRIRHDSCGRHDVLHGPCGFNSPETQLRRPPAARSSYSPLVESLGVYGIEPDSVVAAFHVFRNVEIDPDGRIVRLVPRSRGGDFIDLEAMSDLIVGIGACAPVEDNCRTTNAKPIRYEVHSR